ncbi:hypothetical protein BN946_scf184883.g19 [Trametes cinnabarina]|uniref:DH domain-containing protein n=1 Tax=Pycnoporus cinnabarinus TaxID=5643 RepID=A0A060SM08_PYCCI|nr:hypothetical protein BN946_scf184883.g19 [Trametes cinnabarina]
MASERVEDDHFGEGAEGEEDDQFIDPNDVVIEFGDEGDHGMDEDFEGEGAMDGEGMPEEEIVYEDNSIQHFPNHKGSVFAISTHPTAPLAASGGEDDLGYLWDIVTGDELVKLTGHTDSVTSTAFSADGELVATGGMDGKVRIWRRVGKENYRTWEFLTELSGLDEVMWLRWHPKGNVLLAGSNDTTVWLWQLPSGNTMQVFAGHMGPVTCGDFTADGKRIVTADGDGTLIYWDPRSPTPVFKLTSSDARFDLEGITSLAINPASTLAVVGGASGGVRVVSLSKGEVVGALAGHKEGESVEAVEFVELAPAAPGVSPAASGGVVVTGATDGKACIWDLNTMRLRATLEHGDAVTSLHRLPPPKAHLIVSASVDRTLKTWDARTGTLVREHKGHHGPILQAALGLGGSVVPLSCPQPIHGTTPSSPHHHPPPARPPSPPKPPPPSARDPPLSPVNLWADRRPFSFTPSSATARSSRISLDATSQPSSRPSSAYEPEQPRLAFPEPQLYRSSSQRSSRSSYRPPSSIIGSTHRSSRSDSLLSPDSLITPTQYANGESRPPSFESTPETAVRDLSSELSDLTLDSEEALRKFQGGELYDDDEEWYRLVPPEAREVLDRKEVQRQSILFEIIKSEKDYVADLQLVKEVFVEPLIATLAVPEHRVKGFVQEVFFNIDAILAHHHRMLAALFARQREQHPLIQSVSDIILDNTLLFRNDYEAYIKHYPLAEARHRSEMRRSQRYQYFLQQCSLDPRVRKRDIITFLSRPVTRLPRLLLLLENAKKFTEVDHPDVESIPLVIGILNDFIKSTQPGIAASEDKVKFWNLCESLVYQKGEIIDLDLYDESRSLRFQGPLSRRYKTNMDLHWADLHVALLDNYRPVLLLKPEARSSSVTKNHVVSRPIPLEYLRLGMFDSPPENRKEKAEEGSGLLDRVRSRYRPMYPFTIYHASSKMHRRYTLYAPSEETRKRWHDALVETMAIRQIRQESNMLFATHVVNEGFFRYAAFGTAAYGAGSHYTGRINAATELGSHRFIAVACTSGVYIAIRGEPYGSRTHAAFRKVLTVPNPTCMVSLPVAGKFFVLHEGGLFAYSLDLVCRAALGFATVQSLEGSKERISTDVVLFRVGRVGTRLMVLYAVKSFLQLWLYALEVVHPAESSNSVNHRWSSSTVSGFRSFGEPLSIPKDTHNITVLSRRIVICSDKGTISVADPANLSLSLKSTTLPDFSDADDNAPMTALKARCASAKPLGIVRCPNSDELLVIYDVALSHRLSEFKELGCYIDKHGVPTRSSGYLRWETRAASYAHRGDYILLLSPEFIEVRTVHTGKLVQVIEGADIRRIDAGLLSPDKDSTTLVAMKGKEDRGLVADKVLELVETSELRTPRVSEVPGAWDEFDVLS